MTKEQIALLEKIAQQRMNLPKDPNAAAQALSRLAWALHREGVLKDKVTELLNRAIALQPTSADAPKNWLASSPLPAKPSGPCRGCVNW